MCVGLSRLRRSPKPVYFIKGDCIVLKAGCRRFIDRFWMLGCSPRKGNRLMSPSRKESRVIFQRPLTVFSGFHFYKPHDTPERFASVRQTCGPSLKIPMRLRFSHTLSVSARFRRQRSGGRFYSVDKAALVQRLLRRWSDDWRAPD